MKIHPLSSINELRELHKKYFADQFDFPEFVKHFIYLFEVRDQHDQLITGGGIKLVPELVVITDMEQSVTDRNIALKTALNFSSYALRKEGFHELHAFVQGQKWTERLLKTGFRPTRGTLLVWEI